VCIDRVESERSSSRWRVSGLQAFDRPRCSVTARAPGGVRPPRPPTGFGYLSVPSRQRCGGGAAAARRRRQSGPAPAAARRTTHTEGCGAVGRGSRVGPLSRWVWARSTEDSPVAVEKTSEESHQQGGHPAYSGGPGQGGHSGSPSARVSGVLVSSERGSVHREGTADRVVCSESGGAAATIEGDRPGRVPAESRQSPGRVPAESRQGRVGSGQFTGGIQSVTAGASPSVGRGQRPRSRVYAVAVNGSAGVGGRVESARGSARTASASRRVSIAPVASPACVACVACVRHLAYAACEAL
jgi:hypothetical protein